MRDTVTHLKRAAILILGLLLLGYFVFHTIYGSKGMVTERALQTKLEATQDNLKAVEGDRRAMERRVQGLKPESLDPDLLDEEARRQLGLSKPDEKIILTPQEEQQSGQ